MMLWHVQASALQVDCRKEEVWSRVKVTLEGGRDHLDLILCHSVGQFGM